jgi:hypothetical protein
MFHVSPLISKKGIKTGKTEKPNDVVRSSSVPDLTHFPAVDVDSAPCRAIITTTTTHVKAAPSLQNRDDVRLSRG